jgi:hypothetical protein
MSPDPTSALLFEEPFYLPAFIEAMGGRAVTIPPEQFGDDDFAAKTTDALRAAIARQLDGET